MSSTMNILRPEILTIEGRQYRKQPYIFKGLSNSRNTSVDAPYIEDEDEAYYNEVGSCTKELEGVEQTSTGYKLTVEDVPSFYFKFICGAGGKVKKDIELQTKTSIQLPKQGEEGCITITGKDRSTVLSAKTRLEVIVESSRHKQPATHFLSIPLMTADIEKEFDDFKTAVLDTCGDSRGLDASIFQLPCRLHLTLALLILQNDAEISQANSILANAVQLLSSKYELSTKPFRIMMTGIEYMNDEPQEIDVLYAKVKADDHSDRLQNFVDDLVAEFDSSGLLKRDGPMGMERQPVKLHATIINTIFRSSRDEENSEQQQPLQKAKGGAPATGKGRKVRVTFNGSYLLKVFNEYDFGFAPFSAVELSQRGRYGAAGYYYQAGVAEIPCTDASTSGSTPVLWNEDGVEGDECNGWS